MVGGAGEKGGAMGCSTGDANLAWAKNPTTSVVIQPRKTVVMGE